MNLCYGYYLVICRVVMCDELLIEVTQNFFISHWPFCVLQSDYKSVIQNLARENARKHV